MDFYRTAGVCVVAVAVVVGTAACGASSSVGQAASSTAAGATAVTFADDTQSTATPSSSAGPARSLATGACRTWQTALDQSSAVRAATARMAARQAGDARQRDQQWTKLSKEMEFVSALPETGNTAADQQTAVDYEQDIDSQCAELGIAGH